MNSANPMLNLLNQSSGSSPAQLNQIKNMMNLLRSAGNPQMMLQQMMQNNPQLKMIMDYVNRNGGDYKKAFYNMAQ